jgi:hypothetical protein
MRLQEQINRIHSIMNLISEEKDIDFSKIIKEFLDDSIVKPNNDIICGVEVKHPKDREVLEGQPNYKHYSVTITFIGGRGPIMTQEDKYDYLMDETWAYVYDFFNIPVDVYSKYTKSC